MRKIIIIFICFISLISCGGNRNAYYNSEQEEYNDYSDDENTSGFIDFSEEADSLEFFVEEEDMDLIYDDIDIYDNNAEGEASSDYDEDTERLIESLKGELAEKYPNIFYDDDGYDNDEYLADNKYIDTEFDDIEINLPVTFEDYFPMGKRVTIINENGSVTQYSETRCSSCNNNIPGASAPVGMCQVCQGAGGRMLYDGNWMQCSHCYDPIQGRSTGMCPNCKGTGFQRMYYYKDRFGVDYGVDMNGNVFFPNIGSNGSARSEKKKWEKVGEKEYFPPSFDHDTEVWCEKCERYRPRHVHIPIYR